MKLAVGKNFPHEGRNCTICDSNDIGDEFHYFFKCNYFESERRHYLKPYFYKRPNIIKKFWELLCFENVTLLHKLSRFSEMIMMKFSNAQPMMRLGIRSVCSCEFT